MKLKVGVFFGGESVEHEISIISANQAMHALDKEKYEVIPIYISKKREFYTGSILFNLESYKNLDSLLGKLVKINLVKRNNLVYIEADKKSIFSKPLNSLDLAIPVIHGTNGEDGSLQGYLEMLDLPYSSSDVVASAIGQDKTVSKAVLKEANINVVDGFYIYDTEYEESFVKDKAENIGYPLVIKPARLGSSIGIMFASNYEELKEAIIECGRYDNKLLIEKKIESFREINCSVIGDYTKAKTSLLEEVGTSGKMYDFNVKYGEKGMASSKRQVPAQISKEKEDEIRDMALRAFRALDASGVCRIDFMMDENENVYLNEVNNIPGSLAFYLWDKMGLSFNLLMDELVEIALNRANKKSKRIYSYESNVLSNLKANNKNKLSSKI